MQYRNSRTELASLLFLIYWHWHFPGLPYACTYKHMCIVCSVYTHAYSRVYMNMYNTHMMYYMMQFLKRRSELIAAKGAALWALLPAGSGAGQQHARPPAGAAAVATLEAELSACSFCCPRSAKSVASNPRAGFFSRQCLAPVRQARNIGRPPAHPGGCEKAAGGLQAADCTQP